ncbi:MAG: GAF domain-containing SpoIIE family protein phosphatase [Cytophagaceae bacterium]
MGISSKKFYFIYISLAVLSWLVLLSGDLLTLYSLHHPTFDFSISGTWRNTFLSIFFLLVFLIFKIEIGKKRGTNFIEMLWQVFIIGGITVLVSLVIKFLINFFQTPELKNNEIFVNFIYHVNIGLILIFLANGFYVWKKMILYQKTKTLNILWHVFEYAALISILTNFMHINLLEDPQKYLYFIPLFLFGTVLSFNLKWVAFLNFKQKWQSILLIFLIIVITFTFLEQIYDQHFGNLLIVDLTQNLFVAGVSSFILLNSFSALLVLLFNLPTSSVFEQKFGEVMIFQKLNQSIQRGKKEEEVYEILLESSLNTVMADAGWLEIVDEKGNFKAFLNKNISEIDIFEIKKVLRKNHVNIDNLPQYMKNIKMMEHAERIQKVSFKSMLIIPLYAYENKLGTLVLLKNLEDGFDKEMVDIIYTFVSQASIAIKNFRLIDEAIATERYKEELKIAKEVQRSLLPQSMMSNINIEISAFSKAADEVGGDYYDIFEYSPTKFALVIGDVSGNGTSAAFNMAQMKGVFQSLAQLNAGADEFMTFANNALSRCLEKTSFITLSIFIFDTEKRTIEFARAGHCPPLYFKNETNTIDFINSKGLGLGIIRGKDYSKHIEKKIINYCPGDIMLLYTDGIVEAANQEHQEYGFDKLKNLLYLNHQLKPKEINELILNDFYNYTGTSDLADDYTFLVIKFM